MKAKKTSRIIKSGLIGGILLSGVLVAVYLYLSAYPSGVRPPLNRTKSFTDFYFIAEEGGEFHLPTGSHISIPKDAVVDEEGKKVHGKVRLKFREYHSAEEIFVAGIPMQRESDRNEYLESGGMMEIRLEQGGRELSIKNDSDVNIDLANYRNANVAQDFRMFFLTDDREWDEGRSFETIPNFRRDSALAALPPAPSIPISPVAGEEDRIFSLAFDSRTLPHIKAWHSTEFRFRENIEGLPYEEALRVNWDQIKVEKSDKEGLLRFSFSFSKANVKGTLIKHHSVFLAEPMLEGEALELAMAQFEEDMEKYAVTIAKLDQERARLELEASMLSRFTVENVGIFNIDMLSKLNAYASVDIQFDFEDEINPLVNQVMLHVILEDRNSVIKLNFPDWDKVPALDERVSLAAVLPDGTVAFVDADKYREVIKAKQLRKDQQYTFRFNTERISNEDLFDRIDKKTSKRKPEPRFV